MRTALTRTASLALAACAAAAASCSFDRIDGAVEVDVSGMPQAAIRAEAVITDANGGTLKREPHFGSGVYTTQPLVLTFPAIPSGNFSVQVIAYDSDSTEVGVGNGTGTYAPPSGPDQPLPTVALSLGTAGIQGTYGTPCILSGTGVNDCSGSDLVCKQYSANDQGVCTHACTGNSSCETTPAGADCEAFLGVAANTFCQWECTGNDAGSCPPGLTCGAAVSASGGKRFCQGSL